LFDVGEEAGTVPGPESESEFVVGGGGGDDTLILPFSFLPSK